MTPGDDAKRGEYTARINRVIDHIELNLSTDLSLSDLAKVASFSRFHFHRIFSAMMGEPLNQFIQRLRIEKAANQLLENTNRPITDIALDCGFSSSASFARVFKESYKMSASDWRNNPELKKSKIRITKSKDQHQDSKARKAFSLASYYSLGDWICTLDADSRNLIWRNKMNENTQIQVEVKGVPEFQVAYVRHIGPYKGDGELFRSLYEKLMRWAGPRDLFGKPDTKMLTVYHDDPNLTDENKLRISACISIPDDMPVDGEVGKMTIAGGKYAIAKFELANDEFEAAWDSIMGGWLPESGYQPDDRYCFELGHNDPANHPENKHIIDIYVPVKPL